MKILITGFEPFLDHAENASWVAATELSRRGVEGVEIAIEQLPVSFRRVKEALQSAVERHSPEALIMVGQAAASDTIRLERIAINMMDAKSGDNDGYIPDEVPIEVDQPAALFTTMPIKRLAKSIEERGVAVSISNSCGLYVCNRTYYEGLRLAAERIERGAIFVHLPLYVGQHTKPNQKPTMPLDDMVVALQTLINEIND